jgi:hypothetical protein
VITTSHGRLGTPAFSNQLVFGQSAGTSDPESLFRDLTGGDFEADERRGVAATFRRRSGLVGARRRELIEQPGRVDYTVLGPVDLQVAPISGSLADASLGHTRRDR